MVTWTCNINHHSHCDPVYDELYAKWFRAVDPEESKKLVYQALHYTRDQALALFLWQVPGIYVTAPTVKGLKMRSDFAMILTDVEITSKN